VLKGAGTELLPNVRLHRRSTINGGFRESRPSGRPLLGRNPSLECSDCQSAARFGTNTGGRGLTSGCRSAGAAVIAEWRQCRLLDRRGLRAAQRCEANLRVARSGLDQPRWRYRGPPLRPLHPAIQKRSALCRVPRRAHTIHRLAFRKPVCSFALPSPSAATAPWS
jgi:hypothetical protein